MWPSANVERFNSWINPNQKLKHELMYRSVPIWVNVPLGEWEKIPRLQATTLVGLRYYEKLSQNLSFGL
jgi:hypothetical protein